MTSAILARSSRAMRGPAEHLQPRVALAVDALEQAVEIVSWFLLFPASTPGLAHLGTWNGECCFWRLRCCYKLRSLAP
ncbi:hypothetical protein SKAU_G00153420 [Synaphobranchus kaupii]|uniref:Uncharacterized protein n=1 Tax=Synaphobranchus kaupii TaxID=118154 RepID=A0A9Q1IZ67_SYNKA|nr:hypothetical protein SKAU_G00153420 [Synaphobranchus kaupii]